MAETETEEEKKARLAGLGAKLTEKAVANKAKEAGEIAGATKLVAKQGVDRVTGEVSKAKDAVDLAGSKAISVGKNIVGAFKEGYGGGEPASPAASTTARAVAANSQAATPFDQEMAKAQQILDGVDQRRMTNAMSASVLDDQKLSDLGLMPKVAQTAETWGNGLSGNSSVTNKEEGLDKDLASLRKIADAFKKADTPVAAAPKDEGGFKQAPLPALNTERGADGRVKPTDFGGIPATDRPNMGARSAANYALQKNMFDKNERLNARKAFANDMVKANFDPSKASAEDKASFYERGESMGLTAKQMNKYAQSYLNKPTPAAKPKNTAREFAQRPSTEADLQYTQPTEGYRPLTEEDDEKRRNAIPYTAQRYFS